VRLVTVADGLAVTRLNREELTAPPTCPTEQHRVASAGPAGVVALPSCEEEAQMATERTAEQRRRDAAWESRRRRLEELRRQRELLDRQSEAAKGEFDRAFGRLTARSRQPR
jgi:hypothetical protein